jgi:molybdopterin synthase sulfur carrier subunit
VDHHLIVRLRHSKKRLRDVSLTGMSNMKIKIKYYASFKEFTQKDEETLDLDADMTLAEVRDYVKSLYEKIGRQEQVLVALNGNFKPLDTVVRDRDILSFFPPVSGG